MKKHPLSRKDRLINAELKEKKRLDKEAAQERQDRLWRKRVKELTKERETEDELRQFAHEANKHI